MYGLWHAQVCDGLLLQRQSGQWQRRVPQRLTGNSLHDKCSDMSSLELCWLEGEEQCLRLIGAYLALQGS